MTAQATGAKPKPKMKVRNVKFDFNSIQDNHYVSKNMFATHFMNALHILFPEGEKFFIRSIKTYMKDINDPLLKKEVRDFMGQEGVHFREHERFWEQMEKMGLKPRPLVNTINKAVDGVEKALNWFLPKKAADKLALSITVGMEHYTALFGQQYLTNFNYFSDAYPKQMLMLTMWHSAEELEHKSVAFDVLKIVDDSYFIRMLGMFIASSFFYTFATYGMFYFIAQDPQRNFDNAWEQFTIFLDKFIQKPEGLEGWRILLDYFKPGFHPDDHDNYHLAEEFFKQYEADLK